MLQPALREKTHQEGGKIRGRCDAWYVIAQCEVAKKKISHLLPRLIGRHLRRWCLSAYIGWNMGSYYVFTRLELNSASTPRLVSGNFCAHLGVSLAGWMAVAKGAEEGAHTSITTRVGLGSVA